MLPSPLIGRRPPAPQRSLRFGLDSAGRYGTTAPRDTAPLRIASAIADDELERSAGDSAGVIDFANGELESGKQVLTCFDPARAGQLNKSADLDRRSVSPAQDSSVGRLVSHHVLTLPTRVRLSMGLQLADPLT